LRRATAQRDVLLIADEVMSAFGRCGEWFAWQRHGEAGRPDLMTLAKGLTNGAVPMGATLVSDAVHAAFMQGPPAAIELFHGYTYSAHPLACAAALATLDTYAEEHLFERAIELGDYWQSALHSLRGLPHVVDIRNFGLIGAVELMPRKDAPGARGYEVFERCFREGGLLVRCTGDVIALSPPLIIDKAQIDRIVEILGDMINATA
jgi:beta-alanine--pyruvate transaminase